MSKTGPNKAFVENDNVLFPVCLQLFFSRNNICILCEIDIEIVLTGFKFIVNCKTAKWYEFLPEGARFPEVLSPYSFNLQTIISIYL